MELVKSGVKWLTTAMYDIRETKQHFNKNLHHTTTTVSDENSEMGENT